MRIRAFRLPQILVGIAVLAMLAGGCARRAGEVFPAIENPPSWPAPPDPVRVRYLGQLTAEADLRPGKSMGQAIGDALFGKKPQPGFLTPYALCTDGADRLFVADSGGQTVHVLDLARRKWSRLAPANGPKRFGSPVGVAYDPAGEGRLFVADSADQLVYVFSGGKTPAGVLGAGYLSRPCGVAFDAERERVLVVDAGAHQLIVLGVDGMLIDRIGGRGSGPGEFNFPTNVAIDSAGRVYVSDSLNFRIQQFGPDLRPIRSIGRKGDMPGYFSQPKGLAVDGDDHLYVVDANFEAVQIFDADGRLLLNFGEEGRDPGEFWLPAGVAFDQAKNRLWVADSYNRRVQAFEYVPNAVAAAAAEVDAAGAAPPAASPATLPADGEASR